MKDPTNQLIRPTSLGRSVLVNTGALASANLWRILVTFVIQVLVARILGLEALGQYTVAMAYLNISQVLCELGLPLWMVRELAQAPQLRRAYFRRCVIIQVTVALLLWALLVGLATLLPYPQETSIALFWVGASLPLFAITSATATIFQAAERMELAFVIDFVTNLLILILSVWALWQQQGIAELLLIAVISLGASMIVGLGLLYSSRLLAAPQLPAPLSMRKIAQGALPFFGLSLTDVLLQRLDILLLSFFGDARLLGLYSAGYNLVRVAIKLLQSIWRGVYPTLARLYPTTPAEATKLARTLLYGGSALCICGALLVSLLAEPILHLVYVGPEAAIGGASAGATTVGPSNSEAATAFAWLIWQVPLFFIELYATTWLLVTARASVAFALGLAHVCLLALLLPFGAMRFGAMGAAWGTLTAQAVASAFTFWHATRQRVSR